MEARCIMPMTFVVKCPFCSVTFGHDTQIAFPPINQHSGTVRREVDVILNSKADKVSMQMACHLYDYHPSETAQYFRPLIGRHSGASDGHQG